MFRETQSFWHHKPLANDHKATPVSIPGTHILCFHSIFYNMFVVRSCDISKVAEVLHFPTSSFREPGCAKLDDGRVPHPAGASTGERWESCRSRTNTEHIPACSATGSAEPPRITAGGIEKGSQSSSTEDRSLFPCARVLSIELSFTGYVDDLP